MKLTDTCSKLYKRSTTHFPDLQYYKYDFRRATVLKNSVVGKGDRTKRAVCVEEMLAMLACLKESDFDQHPCTQVIDTFNRCVHVMEDKRRATRDGQKPEIVSPTDSSRRPFNRLSSKQVTELLRRFPEP